jgi:putative transposase
MKKTRFTETQILKVLKEQESGKKVSEICREYYKTPQILDQMFS